ncbi:hypothetical protein I6G82_02555 [Lysinibacillus macroides]|uniref:Uncharacterized protein n=1 Tax=Lysinibacillus macroides TaxID=33935 RepID=A0A0N0CV64_9BACI|nr:hypothetical protein [Lysinibacillus macroides]KOY81305.1 hypothetical protein ADM90_19415 [Lysinibacillus macroides]QPR68532.1 hypothetical protein I6G82_02555 [Lysinibacillus macroides]
MKDAWVLRLKDEFNDLDVPQYYTGNDDDEGLTDDLSQANIVYNKENAENWMRNWEKAIFEKFGEDAICNAGYTHMMNHFDWVEVTEESTNVKN